MNYRALITLGIGLSAGLACGWLALPRVLYDRMEQPIQFSHKTHTGEAVGMACEDCHSLTADGRFTGLPRIENCASCHTEPMGQSPGEKQLAAMIADGKEIAWHVYARQPENVYFSHAPHVKLAEIKCERCHGPHGSSDRLPAFERNRLSTYSRNVEGRTILLANGPEWDGMKMTDCSACHHERGVEESCLTCHK